MEKTINSVRFVALSEMTERDWRILDWDFLRNKARNRIASLMVKGKLKGFYHVNVLMKARAKPDYYVSASIDDEYDLDSDAAEILRHEADDEFETTDVENVNGLISENSLLRPVILALAIGVLIKKLQEQVGQGNRGKDDLDRLTNMLKRLQTGNKLDNGEDLLLAAYIYIYYGKSKWERLLDRLTANKELDELDRMLTQFEELNG